VKQFKGALANAPYNILAHSNSINKKIYSPAIAYAFFCFGFVSFFVASTKNKRNSREGDKILKYSFPKK